jgi:hypothetical protein
MTTSVLPDLHIEHAILPMRDLRVEFTRDRKDLKSRDSADKATRIVLPDGKRLAVSDRFWNSFSSLFNLGRSTFSYFSHAEVFDRLTKVLNNRARLAYENKPVADTQGRLLACTAPGKPLLQVDEARRLISDYDGISADYGEGVITARFDCPFPSNFAIAGDDFTTQFHLTMPVDGYGLPASHLALLRMVCANGMVASAPAFKTMFQLARNEAGLDAVLRRAMESFNNEEGFHTLRLRVEEATKSWASVHEAWSLRRAIESAIRMEGTQALPRLGPTLAEFDKTCGNPLAFYGITSAEELSTRKARSIPVETTVYDLMNFASEVGTHKLENRMGRSRLNGWIGDTVAQEYDLEGTVAAFPEYRDYFLNRTHPAPTTAECTAAPALPVPHNN